MLVLDDYVMDVLMRDLVGHDRAPSAFLVYLHLWAESEGKKRAAVRSSHQTIAETIGYQRALCRRVCDTWCGGSCSGFTRTR